MEKTQSASCYDKTECTWLLNGRCIDFKWFWKMNWTDYSNNSAYTDFACDWNGHCVSICTEMMGSHTMMNGMCGTKRRVTSLSVITWSQGYPYFGNLTCRAACHNCHHTACRRFVSTNSLLFLPFSHLPHILNKQTVATWFLRYLVPLPLKALSKRSKDMLPTDDMGRFFSAMNNAYAIS